MTERKITPCLWFDNQAEEAARFYTSVFPRSEISNITRYGKEGYEIHGMEAGSVLTVSYTLDGNPFIALNGGPVFKFNEAVSFQVLCKNQEEIDYYWDKLTEGGEEGQCGWLKDRFGVSWQVVPAILPELLNNPEKSEKVTKAFLQMKKFDIKKLLQV
jgi:predicted 3-demethylubiquinone-9 3-methyltransferase (glyoxalase superfamily)